MAAQVLEMNGGGFDLDDVEAVDLRAGDAAVLARAVHRPRPVPENEKRMAFVLFFSEINKTS